MTKTPESGIFQLTAVHTSGVVVALVTVTITGAGALSFTAARCPNCRTLIMAVPGPLKQIEARAIAHDTPFSTCRGRVVRCPTRRCKTMVEVIEHDSGKAA